MKTNKKLMLAVTISLLAMQPYNVFAANADDFRTDEYSGIGENVFDLINAADAYAQGYTGKGVTVGVTDIVANFKHPEFAGKENNVIVYDPMNGNYGSLSFQNLAHGTHVSGIIAANKDGYGMHGVAYDAGIASSSLAQYYFPVQSIDETPSYIPSEKIYDYYLTNPDIKIINNSWGAPLYVYSIKNDDDFINFKTEAENHIEAKYTIKPVAKAVNSDKLLIFGAGNSGHLTAGLENNLDVLYGDKAFNDNIITVTAAKANSFIKKDGVFEVKSDAIAVFSDLAMYNEDTALSAPGYDIYSANADFENPKGDGKYVYMSGTSMAAPVVTGVGALVQQAFPYLGGKQIGDVLLSTANDNISAKDNSFVTIQEDYFYNDSGEQESSLTLNVLITGEESVLDSESDYIKGWSELYRYLKNNKETVSTWFFGSNGWNKLFGENGTIQSAEKLKEKFEELFGATNIKIYENVPLDVIFGQGIVDAGNAVNGLGAINVRRLDSSDRSSDYTVAGIEGKTEQALYKVDTQGYNSVWSNDISEIRAGYIAENPLENDASAKPDDTDNSGYDADSEEFAGL